MQTTYRNTDPATIEERFRIDEAIRIEEAVASEEGDRSREDWKRVMNSIIRV